MNKVRYAAGPMYALLATLGETVFPGVADGRVDEEAGALLRRQIVAVDARLKGFVDADPRRIGLDQLDRIVDTGDSRCQHAHVPAAPAGIDEALDHVRSRGAVRQLPAGPARLRDLQPHRSPLPDIADAGGLLDHAGQGQ